MATTSLSLGEHWEVFIKNEISSGRYTEPQWGKSQRNSYLQEFEKRFRWLAENPRLEKHRSDVTEGYYSYPQGQHVIFYLIGQVQTVLAIRLLRMPRSRPP